MALFFANLAIILETFKSYAGGLHGKYNLFISIICNSSGKDITLHS
jgi:hypothetical protein